MLVIVFYISSLAAKMRYVAGDLYTPTKMAPFQKNYVINLMATVSILNAFFATKGGITFFSAANFFLVYRQPMNGSFPYHIETVDPQGHLSVRETFRKSHD